MLVVVTSDNVRVNVEEDVAQQCGMLAAFAESPGRMTEDIPLPNINSMTFRKVLEYCEHYRSEPVPLESPSVNRRVDTEWDKVYIGSADQQLHDIILAANYLNCKPLLDVGCRHIADKIKGKTPEEIRQLFNKFN